jgi:hypothetical protein
MSKLSKLDEARILGALDVVREQLDSGATPNDAITKVAADHQLRPEFVQLMINAVNTGQTNQHRRDAGGDPIKAAEEFPLADPNVILERLYPTKCKTAAETQREEVVSSAYGCQAGAERMWQEKTAADKRANYTPDWTRLNGELIKKPRPYPGLMEDMMKKAMGEVERAKQRTDNTRMAAQKAFDKASAAICELVDYFQKTGGLSFTEVSTNSIKLFGKKAEGLMKMVAGQLHDNTKKAAAHYDRPIDHTKAPYKTVRQCLAYSTEYQQKRATYMDTAKEASAAAERAVLPFALHPVITGSVLDGETSWFDKIGIAPMAATGLLGTIGRIKDLGASFSRDSANKTQDKITNELLDPAHEAEMRNIQAQAMLTKLISGPFSRYEPEDVMDAYNRVSPFIPEAAQHEALAQDAIQKQLAGGHNAMDIFTIGQLTDINKKIRDSREPSDVQARMLGFGAKPQQQHKEGV